MKKVVATFALALMCSSIALADMTPDKKLEQVIDPSDGSSHAQCINPGDNCDAG